MTREDRAALECCGTGEAHSSKRCSMRSECDTCLPLADMSATPETPPKQREFEEHFTMFAGSCPEDVSHARLLWKSLSLPPPQESRLVSLDIRQRLPVSRPQGSSNSAAVSKLSVPGPPSVAARSQWQEERKRYLAMAEQRKEVLARLRQQREQRVLKELLSVGFQPKTKLRAREQKLKAERNSESETEDRRLVRELR
ncbi:cilia- and flagella-associated protein HOATZ [Aulostomus maculatus]